MNRQLTKDETLSAGQMQPINTAIDLSNVDVYYHLLAQVELYAMNTTIFVTDDLATNVCTPANFALYLFGLLLSYINKYGVLSGSNKNDVSLAPEEYVVPTGFAKIMEHYGCYTVGKSVIKTSYALNSALTTVNSTFGTGVPAHFWGANVGFFGGAANVFKAVTPSATTVGEYQLVPDGATLTLANLWSSAAATISQAIAGGGLSCVMFKTIPKNAPNASAFAAGYNSISNSGDLPGNPNVMWTNITNDYHPEEANLFRSFAYGSGGYGSNFQKGVVRCSPLIPYDIATASTLAAVSPHYFNAWIGSRQAAYRPGAILKSYLLCKSPVKSLCYTPQLIDVKSIWRVAYSAFNEFLRQVTGSLTDAEVARLIYMYYQLTVHGVLARVNQMTPHHTLAGSNQSSSVAVPSLWAPQSSFVSRLWLSMQLPAILVRLIDSIGAVNVNGYVTVPVIPPSDSRVFRNYSDGTVFPQYSVGINSISIVSVEGFFGDPSLTLTGTVPALDFAPDGAVLDTAAFQTYYPDGQALNRVFFWNVNIEYFTGLWDRLHKKAFTGVGLASSLIHLHNPPCGTSAAMIASAVLTDSPDIVNTPNLDFGAGFSGNWNDQQTVSLVSLVDLSPDEIVEAVMLRITTLYNAADNDFTRARFRYQLPTASASSQLIQSYATKTFSPQSSFAQALSAREAAFQPVLATAAGIEIVSTSETEGCWVKDLLRTVARESFSALRFAVPMAAGLVCDMYAPGGGMFCASGADKVLGSIQSYIGIESDGHDTATSNDVGHAKRVLAKATAQAKDLGMDHPYMSKKIVVKPKAPKAITAKTVAKLPAKRPDAKRKAEKKKTTPKKKTA